ncbi:MAG: creatininase family protein, partial [Alphaproteobacteria bacterium]|nr:creatininase family protein [Alphaproteobacteria bacterium]
MRRITLLISAIVLLSGGPTAGARAEAPPANPVTLEDLTWVEIRARIRSGTTAVIVPTGGTEQNGPHMVLGKHNFIVKYTATRIARALGGTLVAPVIAYVPEGRIDPPAGHMRFAGTISISEPVFEALLDATARSLRAHGFRTIFFLGDSGGNQRAQAGVARRLSSLWRREGIRVVHIGAYYAANGQSAWLRTAGETPRTIGRHAGIRDTSELLAIHPKGVRTRLLRRSAMPRLKRPGHDGDPSRASAARGRALLTLKVESALR